MDYSDPEEQENSYERYCGEIGDVLHRYVELPAVCVSGSRGALKLAGGESYGFPDYAARFHDAYDSGHGDTAYAYHSGIFAEDGLRRHCGYLG